MQKSEKKEDAEKARQIEMLAKMYAGLRIAYVEEEDGRFYSVLSKHNGKKMEQEYRIMVSARASRGGDTWGGWVCSDVVGSGGSGWRCIVSSTSGGLSLMRKIADI